MMLMAQSQSTERAGQALPLEGSEDASALLRQPELAEPEPRSEYGPGGLEWAIDVGPTNGALLSQAEVELLSNRRWLRELGDVTVYGQTAEHWTYFTSTEPPTSWRRLALSTQILRTHEQDPKPATATSLEAFLSAVQRRIAAHPNLQARARSEAAFAARHAQRMFECWQRADLHTIVVLTGSAPFAGRDVWDVMLSLGLRWGDMDLFHWRNPIDLGHDQHFSVSTSTEPGYFLPEAIAEGAMNPEDLVFGFSIPRCAAPLHVFEQLMVAARYAQRRLGGSLLDAEGQAFDELAEREGIADVLKTLASYGLEPGRDTTLRLF
jgi:cell division protein ZipA